MSYVLYVLGWYKWHQILFVGVSRRLEALRWGYTRWYGSGPGGARARRKTAGAFDKENIHGVGIVVINFAIVVTSRKTDSGDL